MVSNGFHSLQKQEIDGNRKRERQRERERDIYIYAVELKTGPIFAFSSVKNWSNFFLFCLFLFLKISFSLQKEEDFSKNAKKK